MATFEQLITRTITRLSMVPGYGVQTYAEDQIAEMIWHKFLVARDSLWWDDMMSFATLTLDADGVPTDNIVRTPPLTPVGDEIVINKYSDIQHAWYGSEPYPMKSMPRRRNPTERLPYARLKAPHTDKVIKFYNCESGTVTVRYRTYYEIFNAQDEVPFDEQLLILGAAWDYLEDDGSNPMQIEKFKNLYVERMELLASAENNEELSLGAL